MKILVACEESQAVTIEFRKLGCEAYSCDILPPSGGHREWHIMGDVLPLLNGDCTFCTTDGTPHSICGKWDMIIAFPPCTYLTNVATRHHSLKFTPLLKINARTQKRIDGMRFFMTFANSDCDRIAIENPVGVMNTAYRKPDQIIAPYMFAKNTDDTENYVTKATCFWLKGLNPLKTNNLPKPNNALMWGVSPQGKAYTWEDTFSRNPGVRSKTFSGIARAMAEQWSEQISINAINPDGATSRFTPDNCKKL